MTLAFLVTGARTLVRPFTGNIDQRAQKAPLSSCDVLNFRAIEP
jgi:hypothetical protein